MGDGHKGSRRTSSAPVAVCALVLAVGLTGLTGCTSLLGDFSSGDGAAGVEAGGSDSAGLTGDDANGSETGLVSDDGGGTGDGPSAPCAIGQLTCAAGCVSPGDVHTCGSCTQDCALLPNVAASGLSCSTGGVCSFTCLPGYAHCS